MTSSEITPSKSILLQEGTPTEKREQIRHYFHHTFDTYEQLFQPLVSEEAFTQRADPLRHPLIFYYGHTAVFFINKLLLGKYLNQRINAHFESTFAIGVDEMSWDDLNDAHYDWPLSQEVQAYRDEVRQTIDQLITDLPLTMPIDQNSPFWIILMGIEHERIHLETSSVLIRQLPLHLIRPHSLWPTCPDTDSPAPTNTLLPVSGGHIRLGKNSQDSLYGWDNEYGEHHFSVQDFSASKHLVSNAEFKEFIDHQGYQTQSYWTEEGWSWVQYKQAQHPLFWRKDQENHYQLRLMLQEIDMPWSWPVEINYLEAKAFCNWKSEQLGQTIRLPMEEEWYQLIAQERVDDEPDWQEAPGNINLEHFASSCPVDRFAFGPFYDLIGNAWQWTETPIASFSGFQVHPLYDDFSTPTFDTKHNLIKGGSWISTGNCATLQSRYAFRRHFYQHASFRYIASEAPVVIRDDQYETDELVTPYCQAHYGDDESITENYAEKIAQYALKQSLALPKTKALHFGCKVGRTAFELAVEFAQVTAIDASARTIKVGVAMQDKGYIHYTHTDEGDIVHFHEKHLKEFGLHDIRHKVEFYQSDASNMREIYTGYDLIIADQIIDRIYDPQAFLLEIKKRLLPGGLLIISSPYDWDEQYTQKDKWLGGIKINGENVNTLDALKNLLAPEFSLQEPPTTLPSILPRNRRNFEYKHNQVTTWIKA